LAEVFEQLLRNAPDLESLLLTSAIATINDLIPQPPYLASERIPVDSGEVSTAVVDFRSLQRFPPALGAVVS